MLNKTKGAAEKPLFAPEVLADLKLNRQGPNT